MSTLKWWVKNIFISLLIICPFIPVLSSKLAFVFSPLSIVVAGYKELVQLVLISLLVILVAKLKSFRSFGLSSIVILSFAIYTFFHFLGYMPVNLILDGYRYQVGYVVLFSLFTLLSIDHKRYGVDVHLVAKIIFVQFFIVAFIGLVEFFYPEIIYLIYGVSKEDMDHVTLAGGFRLISVFSNPINFGAFLCFSFCSIYYFALLKDNKLYWIFFWACWLLSLFLIFFTLSRLALITFALQTIIVIFLNFKRLEVVTTVFVLFFIIFAIPTVIILLNDFESLYSRVENLMELDTYTSNSRVSNWMYAISNLDNLLYFLWGLGVGASNPTFNSGGYMIENSFVSIFVELGFIGFVLYVVIFLSVFYRLFFAINLNTSQFSFLLLFFIAFYFMSLGNDLNRNFPFNFYFWYFICYVFSMVKVCNVKFFTKRDVV